METSSLGTHLRREREARGVSLDVVAAATRIPLRTLLAMESDEWNRLPGGVFNRGFVRSVGLFLGLDADGLVAEYVAATQDAPQLRFLEPEPRPLWPVIVCLAAGTVLLIALLVGGWALYRHFHPRTHAGISMPSRRAAVVSPGRQPSEGLTTRAPKP